SVHPDSEHPAHPDAERARAGAAGSELSAAARPYMAALSRAARCHRHAVVLADARGRVLGMTGDAAFAPGAVHSGAAREHAVIGTVFAENAHVNIIGAESTTPGFHDLAWHAVPLRGIRGDIAGMLALHIGSARAAARMHQVVTCAAHGIEAELFARFLA